MMRKTEKQSTSNYMSTGGYITWVGPAGSMVGLHFTLVFIMSVVSSTSGRLSKENEQM